MVWGVAESDRDTRTTMALSTKMTKTVRSGLQIEFYVIVDIFGVAEEREREEKEGGLVAEEEK